MEKWIPPCFRQRFSNDLRDLYTEKLQRNREFGHVIWPALTKVSWVHDDDPEKEEYFFSGRTAGSFMDSILQNTDHVEWLWGETDDIFISERIIHEMAEKGWKPHFHYEHIQIKHDLTSDS